MKAFMKYEIKLPTIEEQKKISSILSTEEEIIRLYEKMLLSIQEQYKYLLNHLISDDFDLTNIELENVKEQQWLI